MAFYTDYRASLWNKRGEFLRYIRATFNCTDAVGEVGTAEFSLSKDDPACRRDLLQVGNYVLFEHARLGDWGGVIAAKNGRSWSGLKVMTTRALHAEFQFSRRRGPIMVPGPYPLSIQGTAGNMLRQVITFANQKQDALLRPGTIWDGGDETFVPTRGAMCSELVADILKKTDTEMWITPARDEHGRLIFLVNLAPKMGTVQNYTLREGVNLQQESGEMMREQGDLVNDMSTISDSGNGYSEGNDEDVVSIGEYGLWQGSDNASSENAEKNSKVVIAKQAWLENVYRLMAIETTETPDTFAHLGKGDIVHLSMYSGEFYYDEIGVETDVRIMSREWNSEINGALLTVRKL